MSKKILTSEVKREISDYLLEKIDNKEDYSTNHLAKILNVLKKNILISAFLKKKSKENQGFQEGIKIGNLKDYIVFLNSEGFYIRYTDDKGETESISNGQGGLYFFTPSPLVTKLKEVVNVEEPGVLEQFIKNIPISVNNDLLAMLGYEEQEYFKSSSR